MLVSFFGSNIALCIEKNPMEELCGVLEMELKMYTPVGPKFNFEKIRFKVLHYIQRHDFIRQRPGLSKNQTSMLKSLFINQLLWSQSLKHSWEHILRWWLHDPALPGWNFNPSSSLTTVGKGRWSQTKIFSSMHKVC